jgi:hypothetical protein
VGSNENILGISVTGEALDNFIKYLLSSTGGQQGEFYNSLLVGLILVLYLYRGIMQ